VKLGLYEAKADPPCQRGCLADMETTQRQLLSQVDRRGLPNFILIGAQKSGTSSLHYLLNLHEEVFIPQGEIFFFDVDDIEQHPDFFADRHGRLVDHDFEGKQDQYLPWYRSCFAAAGPGQVIGEDSTTYLASARAPERIAAMLPEAKLIAVLRDPVKRAYSHYWHWVSTGRTGETFEALLSRGASTLLTRGHYDEHLSRYYERFPKEQLKVVIFEEFVKAQQSTVDAICAFLGLEQAVDISAADSHRNAARPPLWLRGRLLANHLLSPLVRKSYENRIPGMPGYRPGALAETGARSALADEASEWLSRVWPKKSYPAMAPQTEILLRRHFRPYVERLSEMLDKDLLSVWRYL
jgi:hypothetical protein